MPKDTIDYSNTIIYKICCKDNSIKDVYIGHTTNFTQRKYLHKTNCINSKNNLKIYTTIRANGGWNNWDMIELAKYNCKNQTEARIKEQLHFEVNNSTLNSCAPYVNKHNYYCMECELQCNNKNNYDTLGLFKNKIS